MSEKQLYAGGQEITPLGNYDKDAAAKVIKELQTAMAEFVEKINHTLEEAKAYSDSTYIQATAYSDYAIAELINGAPETLNTLKEIADAMQENESVTEALNAAIGEKASEVEYQAHASNETVHVTASERTEWNGYNEKINDITTKINQLSTQISTLQTSINSINSNVSALQTSINNEVTNRKNADALKANLSGGNSLTGRQVCIQTLDLLPGNYRKAAFVSEAAYASNPNARAAYGFHNAGCNAGQLYLDTDGKLKFLNNGVNIYTLEMTKTGEVSTSTSIYG